MERICISKNIQDLAKSHSMRAYFVLYHEATLANLLEVLLYYDYSVEAMEDSMIELVGLDDSTFSIFKCIAR